MKYGTKTYVMKMDGRRMLHFIEMKCSQSMWGVTKRDRCRNEKMRFRVGVREKINYRVFGKVLKWFRDAERLSGERWIKRLYESKVDVEGIEADLARGDWTESNRSAV